MRRDLFHFFEADIESVYGAYLKTLRENPFHKEPSQTPHSLLMFGLGMSFKYNMNGGSVSIHFAKKGEGTAVQVRYSIVQLFGARYKAYDDLLTKTVAKNLGQAAKPLDTLEDSYFEPQEPSVLEDTQNDRPRFCTKCGKPLDPEASFCGYCGARINH